MDTAHASVPGMIADVVYSVAPCNMMPAKIT